MSNVLKSRKQEMESGLQELAIYGAGGFGRHVLAIVKRINAISPTYNVIGFYDDGFKIGDHVNGIPVIGGLDDLNNIGKPINVVLALGWSEVRKRVPSLITNEKVSFPTIIDPSVVMPDMEYAHIGKGCIICESVAFTCNLYMDDFVLLNMGTMVGHDVKLSPFVSTMPSVSISGEVSLGEAVYIGVGATVINRVEVGRNTIIGAGAVVTKSLPSDCTAVGIPAKPIKFR